MAINAMDGGSWHEITHPRFGRNYFKAHLRIFRSLLRASMSAGSLTKFLVPTEHCNRPDERSVSQTRVLGSRVRVPNATEFRPRLTKMRDKGVTSIEMEACDGVRVWQVSERLVHTVYYATAESGHR